VMDSLLNGRFRELVERSGMAGEGEEVDRGVARLKRGSPVAHLARDEALRSMVARMDLRDAARFALQYPGDNDGLVFLNRIKGILLEVFEAPKAEEGPDMDEFDE
jgi:hypothetical protein